MSDTPLVPTFTQPVFTEPEPAAAAPEPAPEAESQTPATTATAPANGPVPLLKGAFAVYVTPQHALVLAYRPEGTTDDKQLVVPPFIVDMAARQSGQTPQELLARLQKGI